MVNARLDLRLERDFWSAGVGHEFYCNSTAKALTQHNTANLAAGRKFGRENRFSLALGVIDLLNSPYYASTRFHTDYVLTTQTIQPGPLRLHRGRLPSIPAKEKGRFDKRPFSDCRRRPSEAHLGTDREADAVVFGLAHMLLRPRQQRRGWFRRLPTSAKSARYFVARTKTSASR
ncbi:MAG: hypothetical protein V8Q28_00485 [Alistipes sp.]